jgi:hypothetical protein
MGEYYIPGRPEDVVGEIRVKYIDSTLSNLILCSTQSL